MRRGDCLLGLNTPVHSETVLKVTSLGHAPNLLSNNLNKFCDILFVKMHVHTELNYLTLIIYCSSREHRKQPYLWDKSHF